MKPLTQSLEEGAVIKILQSNGGFSRVRFALMISVLFHILVGILAGIVYSMASPSSWASRLLDGLGTPAEELTNWVAPGHTGVQPVVAMLFSVVSYWAVIWIVLSLLSWWRTRQ
jgi:hypothetical protein